MPGTTLIVAGGARPEPPVVAAIPAIDFCIAADSGADFCVAAGRRVDVLVGDLDSISAEALEAVRRDGAEIVEYPPDKDQTDLELAFERAARTDPDRIVVVGIGGGRLDHALANTAVLAAAGSATGAPVEALDGTARLSVIVGRRTLHGEPGRTVSLLPVLGDAADITTEGLQYPLVGEPLPAGSARGVSNRFVSSVATVTVGAGVLLAVEPFALGGEEPR